MCRKINWWHMLTLLICLLSFLLLIYVMTYIGSLFGILLYITHL